MPIYQCGTKIAQYDKQKHYKNCQIQHFELRWNENLKTIYGKIKDNARAANISEVKNIEKASIEKTELKQSTRYIEQYCCKSSEYPYLITLNC